MPLKLSKENLNFKAELPPAVDVDVVPEIPSVEWAITEAKKGGKLEEQAKKYGAELDKLMKVAGPVMQALGIPVPGLGG